MKQKTASPVLTIEETRRVLGDDKVSYATVWKWARDGNLPTVKIGKKVFVLREPFLAMLKGQPPERPAA